MVVSVSVTVVMAVIVGDHPKMLYYNITSAKAINAFSV
jgi:hypothetical protein